MLWLYILLGALLFILLILLIPIRMKLKYQNELLLSLYIGFVKLRLIPAKPKKPKKEKSKKKTDEKPKETEKKKNIIKEKGISWLVNLIKKLAQLAGGVLKDFFKHIIIRKLMLSIVVAEEDAAKTAVNYGYYCSAVYPAVGIIVKTAKCKKYGVDIKPDFDENAKPDYFVELDAKIRVIWILAVLIGHSKEFLDVIKELK